FYDFVRPSRGACCLSKPRCSEGACSSTGMRNAGLSSTSFDETAGFAGPMTFDSGTDPYAAGSMAAPAPVFQQQPIYTQAPAMPAPPPVYVGPAPAAAVPQPTMIASPQPNYVPQATFPTAPAPTASFPTTSFPGASTGVVPAGGAASPYQIDTSAAAASEGRRNSCAILNPLNWFRRRGANPANQAAATQ
ncbi:MAG: hypothetical protein ACRDD1_11905, partial [Planctomycetia bacterium]